MKKFRITLIILLILATAIAFGLFLMTRDIPVLEPKGMIAVKQKELIITSFLLMLIVVIPVFIFTLYFAWKYRAENDKAQHSPDWEHNSIAECCWWGVPFVIIIILAVLTWKTSHELNPFRPIETGKKPLEIQVVALDWKWLFIYPEQGIATVNYVQFPEKTPISFEITADAPMNSFWIPQLGGQIYAMPAMRTELHLFADEAGSFRGSSANISGRGFSGMFFEAKATSEEDFREWVANTQGSNRTLDWNEYRRLVEPSEYVPVTFYHLMDRNLFDQILLQYKPSPGN